MNKAKTYIVAFVLVALLFTLGPALLVLVVDPYHIYHKGVIKPVLFSTSERYQNAGLINSYLEGHDAIIIGSSMSQNFDVDQVTRAFGWKKTMRLTVNASTDEMSQEHLLVLKKALSKGDVKYVLWEIHPKYLWVKPEVLYSVSENFPVYLYNQSLLDDYRYLFNEDVVQLALQTLDGSLGEICDNDCMQEWDYEWLADYRVLNQWMRMHLLNPQKNGFAYFSQSKSLESHRKKVINNQSKIRSARVFSRSKNYQSPFISEGMRSIIMQHPDKQFYIYLPPLPSFYFAGKNESFLAAYMGFGKVLLAELGQLENVSIYGFNNAFAITNNVAFYKDDHHYDHVVNAFVASSIAQGDYRLTQQNVDDYFLRFLDNLKTLKVESQPKVNLETLQNLK